MSRRLIVDQLVFRIFGPIISGLVIYLLILLHYNNIEHVLDSFISEELLICIGLSFLISEVIRLILKLYSRLIKHLSETYTWVALILLSLAATVMIVITGLSIYYYRSLGYAPNTSEIQIFVVLYLAYALVFLSLFISTDLMHQAFKRRLKNEAHQRKQTKEHFARFARGINPELLFESLETIITYDRQDKEKADEIIDELSMVYRYTLTKNDWEVIPIEMEMEALDSLVHLVDHLPYRSITIDNQIMDEFHVIPGALLHTVEQIIKSTIEGIDEQLDISLTSSERYVEIHYVPVDKLTDGFTIHKLKELNDSYSIFSEDAIHIVGTEEKRIVRIPKLILES